MRLEGIEKLRRQHTVPLREGPAVLLGLPRGLGIEENRIEVQVVCGAAQGQGERGAGVDAKAAKERAHLDRIAALVIGIEETTEPGKCVPVIRQVDRARLERIGKLHERELGVGNEKHPLGCLEECAAPTCNRGATRVDPACMQLEGRRTDHAACIGDQRKGRTTWEPERSRLSRGQSGDGGVRGDDTVGLDAHRLRVSLAILAKRS